MWWMAAFMAANALEDGKNQRNQAKIDKKQMQHSVQMANKQREVDNILIKAQGDLARYQQARSNKYKLIAGAQSAETQTVNMLRLSDAAVRGNFESRLAASEEAGALAAAVGFAGIGGGSVAMLNATTRLRQQRAQALYDSQVEDQTYDLGLQIDRTREATILGLDDVRFFDNINPMTVQESYIPIPSWGQIAGNAAMAGAQAYASMGGFDGMGAKLGGLFGGGAGTPQLGPNVQAVQRPTTRLA